MYNYQEKIIISYSRVLQFATTGRQASKNIKVKVLINGKIILDQENAITCKV